jgi:MFS family permease
VPDPVVPAITVAGIALASALVPLNSTMIAVALPAIADDFDITTSGASLLITVYLAAMLVGQPIAGRFADIVGSRRLALISVTGFGLCSAAAMFAGTFWVLVALRALQAAFAAGLSPSVQSMLRELVSEEQRGRAFGVQGSVLGAGAGLGPVIGGLAIALFGWRAIFGVNLPVVLVVLYVVQRRIPPSIGDPTTTDPAHAGAADRVFNRAFTVAFSTQALSAFAQYALLLSVPIVLDSRQWNSAAIGAGLSVLTLGMVVMGPYGGRLGDIRGRRYPVVIGLAVTLIAVCSAAAFGDDVPSWLLIGVLLVFGLGLGVASPSLMTAGIGAAPRTRVGAAAGLMSASRYVGSIAATMVLAGVVGVDGAGFTLLLLACAATVVAALAVARALPGDPNKEFRHDMA